MIRFLTLVGFSLVVSVSSAQVVIKMRVPITNPGEQFLLVGELGIGLGETATVEGVIVEGPLKGYDGGPNMVVQRINGVATQQLVQIPVAAYFGDFGKQVYDGSSLPRIDNNATYRCRVYETGEYVGIPAEAYKEAGLELQTSRFYFRNSLRVISAKRTDPIDWSPRDFVDRTALLSGVAANDGASAVIQMPQAKLVLVGAPLWDATEVGKEAEVFGTVRETKAANVYRLENGRQRLCKLEDQLGKTVRLRGTVSSVNDKRWFNYRGTRLYVENLGKLARDFGHIEVTGKLEQAMLPRIDRLVLGETRELEQNYIIRNPQWTDAGELLTPELPPWE